VQKSRDRAAKKEKDFPGSDRSLVQTVAALIDLYRNNFGASWADAFSRTVSIYPR
jgi:hypothetical protein